MSLLAVFAIETGLAAAGCFIAIGAWRLIDRVRSARETARRS